MEIQIKSLRKIPGLGNRKIRHNLETVLRDLAFHNAELSVFFTDDKTISELNQRYLGRSGPTDVLAFPMSDGSPEPLTTEMLGDVVISVDTAVSESARLAEPLSRTVLRLLIHGILHLFGYDHEKSKKDAVRMKREQRRLLALIENAKGARETRREKNGASRRKR